MAEFNDPGSEVPTANLSSRGIVVAFGTGTARVAGLIRDLFLSAFFGATVYADAFYLAFRIPNFFRRLFAEGAFAQAFVPILSEYRERTTIEEVRRFVQTVSGNFAVFLVGLCTVGVLGAPVLVYLFTAGGWVGDLRFDLAVDMVRIMFPYLGFIALTAFYGSLLNSYDRYAVPAFTPVLLSLCLISGALVASDVPIEPIYALAWSVFIAGILQLLFQVPSVHRLHLQKLPRIDWKHEGVRRMMRLMLPAIFAASATQLNILVGTILASQLIVGSVSWLYYADRFLGLPIALIAIALRTVMLPSLSRLFAERDFDGFDHTTDWGMRVSIILGLPASVALFMIAEPVIATVYHRGEFGEVDIWMSAAALQAYAIAVVPMALVMVASTGFFSRQNPFTPMRYAFVAVGANVVVCLLLFLWLGHVGIAYGATVGAVFNAYLLIRHLLIEGVYRPTRDLAHSCVSSCIACAVMALVLILLNPGGEFWSTVGELERILRMLVLVAGGFCVYVVCLLALGIRMRHVVHRV